MTPEQAAVIDAAIAVVAGWINEDNTEVVEGDLMDAVSALARAGDQQEDGPTQPADHVAILDGSPRSEQPAEVCENCCPCRPGGTWWGHPHDMHRDCGRHDSGGGR